jgi:RNA polymerase sigma-70 factor (ECF subfamily)
VTDGEAASDADLALRAQSGEKRSFDKLITRHKAPLYQFVRRYIGNRDEAYDVLQETFVAAWISLKRYDPEKPFAVWLRSIALNKCRDHGRRGAVRKRVYKLFADLTSILAPETSPMFLEPDKFQRLDEAIAALPAFYKEPLLLTVMGGLSHQETALQLHTTPKAVEMRIGRARKKLAETLSDRKGEG